MVDFKFALAAGFFAALGTAVTQLVELTFVESNVIHGAIEVLFIGATVYIGLAILERTVDSQ